MTRIHDSDLVGALVGLERLMEATSTGVVKSGVTGEGSCDNVTTKWNGRETMTD